MTENDERLPPPLIKALVDERCLLFFGAGVSLNAGIQDARRLSIKLAEELKNDLSSDSLHKEKLWEIEGKEENLRRISQYYDDYYGIKSSHQKIADTLAAEERLAKKEILYPLKSLPTIKEIITTNYDHLVEDVLDPSDCQVIYRNEDLRKRTGRKLQLIKLHGTRTDINSIVLTDEDYHQFFAKNVALVELTKTLLRQKIVIVVGYSLEDDNFATIYNDAIGNESTTNYFVSPDTSLYQKLHWEKKGFVHIKLTAEDFLAKLQTEYEKRTYSEETAKFSDRRAVIIDPQFNPFVLFDTEALAQQNPELLFDTFVSPVGFPTILDHQHTFIEGHRGSGKSTILWRLSIQSFAYDKENNLPMWGFNIKMVPGMFTAFRRYTYPDNSYIETDREWTKYFTHYFNLLILSGILKNLEEAIELKIFTTNNNLKETVRWIHTNLLRLNDSAYVSDLKSLRRSIEMEIDTVVNNRQGLEFYTLPNLIARSLELLSEAIPELNSRLWHILLDEYDNLYPEHQSVVNLILRERHPKIRYKIAVKTLHAYLKDIDGKSLDITDDFGYISCDSVIWDPALKPQYFAFLEKLSEQRLSYAGYDHISIRELLPEPEDSQEYYAGFESFCYLSSGLTRLYLELCKDAVYEAYPESATRKVDLSPIPARIQNHVVKLHSAILFKSYRGTKEPQKVLRLYQVFGPLFYAIAKVTAHQKEYRTPLSFEVRDLDQLTSESLDVLEQSVKSRLLQVPTLPKRPRDPVKDSPSEKYSFHRLLAPFFKLDLTERYAVPIAAKQFNEIWESPRLVQKHLSKGYDTKGIKTHLDDNLPLFDEAT